MKRIISLMLVALLVLSMIPVAVMAASSVTITQQPQSVTVANGVKASVTVKASGTGLTYKWYYKDASATSFTLTTAFKTATYSVEMTNARAGRQVYCVVTDGNGNSVRSATATLNKGTTLKITAQPQSVTVAKGATAKVTVKAQGDGLTYKWYYKDKGATSFTLTTAFKTASYSVSMTDARAGRQVYCVVTDKYGSSVQSATATLNKTGSLAITQQPVSVTVAKGETAKVSFTATGEGLTYTWYYKNKGAASFVKTSTFTGNTYTAEMNATRDGRQIYCVVKDKNGNSVKTNTVTLTMKNVATITKQPVSVAVAEGATAKVSFTATGDGLTYTWYYKNKSASSFLKTNTFTGNTYTAEMNATRDGRQIYCVVKDKYGNSVKTNTVTLSMVTPLVITAQPQNDRGNPGDQATFTVAVSGGKAPYTYQWQMCDYYRDWEDLTNGSWFTGVDTNRLDLIVDRDEFVNENKYRCVITDADGYTVISNAAWVEKIPFSFTKDLTSQYADERETVTFEVAVTGGKAPYTYRWMERAYGGRGTPYEQIGGGWYGYNGYTTSYLEIDMDLAGPLFNYTYYCVVTDADGNSITSNVAMICKPLKIDKQPVNTECSLNGSAIFSVAVSGGSMSYSYEWQCTNSAGNYTTVANLFSNATGTDAATVSIPIYDEEIFGNTRFRCVITDSNGKKIVSNYATVTEALTVTSKHNDYWNTDGRLSKNSNELWVYASGGAGGYTYTWYRKSVPVGENMDDYDFVQMSEGTKNYLDYKSINNRTIVIKCVVTDSAGATKVVTFWLRYSPY